nr:MAG TPA: hypothetical protein [Caudoviricetes sp.]
MTYYIKLKNGNIYKYMPPSRLEINYFLILRTSVPPLRNTGSPYGSSGAPPCICCTISRNA